MKKLMFLFTILGLIGIHAKAETHTETYFPSYRYNANSFIFSEGGIEFSVFSDGQFDFYIPQYGPNTNVTYYPNGMSISYNSGYDYDAYVQYDYYGAIVQIEHIPVYYDFYGRVNRIGNIFIRYNHWGNISSIGGMHIYYNNYGYSHYNGFINGFNRRYVYRPWHRYYVVPPRAYRVVYHTPYRRDYCPTRYYYDKPYRNNRRQATAVGTRRGDRVVQNQRLSTEQRVNLPATRRIKEDVVDNRRISNDAPTRTVRETNNARSLTRENTRTTRENPVRTRTSTTRSLSNDRIQMNTRSNTRVSSNNSRVETPRRSTRANSSVNNSRVRQSSTRVDNSRVRQSATPRMSNTRSSSVKTERSRTSTAPTMRTQKKVAKQKQTASVSQNRMRR